MADIDAATAFYYVDLHHERRGIDAFEFYYTAEVGYYSFTDQFDVEIDTKFSDI